MKQNDKAKASKAAMAKAQAAGNKAFSKSPGQGTTSDGTIFYETNSLKNAFINQAAAMSKSLNTPAKKAVAPKSTAPVKKAAPKKKK